jgi:hypothetical protein
MSGQFKTFRQSTQLEGKYRFALRQKRKFFFVACKSLFHPHPVRMRFDPELKGSLGVFFWIFKPNDDFPTMAFTRDESSAQAFEVCPIVHDLGPAMA